MASRRDCIYSALQAAVAAHEDVDVLVLALGAREQLEPHRRDLMNIDVPAPPPPEHQFLPEEKFLPPPPKE